MKVDFDDVLTVLEDCKSRQELLLGFQESGALRSNKLERERVRGTIFGLMAAISNLKVSFEEEEV